MPQINELLEENQPPHLRLYYFVLDAEEVVEHAVDARHIIFHEAIRERLVLAHHEYRETTASHIKAMLESGEVSSERLEEAGLTGAQLSAKITGYASARLFLLEWGGIKALKRAMRWMNSILGSLSTALPPAEALKELKEFIENGAKDVEELEGMNR